MTRTRMRGQFSRRRVFTGIAVVALAAALSGCTPAGKPAVVPSATGVEPAITVQVIDNRYEPSEVQIEAGQAVRWVFLGSMEHDVVAEDGSFVSELTVEGEYTHVFSVAGDFAYDCSTHPEMTGVVRVS
jgi:plastocyanin